MKEVEITYQCKCRHDDQWSFQPGQILTMMINKTGKEEIPVVKLKCHELW